MRLSLHYGTSMIAVEVPARRVLDVLAPPEIAPAGDPAVIIQDALLHPIHSPDLRQLAHGATSVVILVDDATRPTPAHLILPHIVNELSAARVDKSAVTVLVGLGTHRPMTETELRQKLGQPILDSLRIVQHDHRDAASLVALGQTPSGIPVVLNRLVRDADLTIAVGNIVPHRYCGWAGGAKMIQPGVSGEATTAATHLMITKDPGAVLGNVENSVRHEIEAVADQTSLRFIVNTILTRTGELYDVVAGDFRCAFREGVRRAGAIYGVDVARQADVVLTSSFPADLNFWQAGKALYGADLVVRTGGIIILVSPCFDGMGEHPEFNHLLRKRYQEIEQDLAEGRVHDRIAAAAALAVAKVTERAQVFIVADGISAREADDADLRKFTSVQDAVNTALSVVGEQGRLSLLHEGAEALPIRRQEFK